MKQQNIIKQKIAIADKRIVELIKEDDLKKIPEQESMQISQFYEEKSKNRLATARIIYEASKGTNKGNLFAGYKDYAETVAAAYYAMYYIIHAFLALKYRTKLREGMRGVHAITGHIILYYLVKTKKLAKHLYESYVRTLKTTADIRDISVEDFEGKAFVYAQTYGRSRDAREIFTYNVTAKIEEYHAHRAINTAEAFINTIQQVMLGK